jgi:hypothetical protein
VALGWYGAFPIKVNRASAACADISREVLFLKRVINRNMEHEMVIQRTSNTHRPATAEECYLAMCRHTSSSDPATQASAAPAGAGSNGNSPSYVPEDFEYGGMDIVFRLYGRRCKKLRRRIYRIAEHHFKRGENSGFFKDKGMLCLCVPVWLKFRGLA